MDGIRLSLGEARTIMVQATKDIDVSVALRDNTEMKHAPTHEKGLCYERKVLFDIR
jgi:hypothetical protein